MGFSSKTCEWGFLALRADWSCQPRDIDAVNIPADIDTVNPASLAASPRHFCILVDTAHIHVDNGHIKLNRR
jgi:hypothetical protein